jgi:hypothetical protein
MLRKIQKRSSCVKIRIGDEGTQAEAESGTGQRSRKVNAARGEAGAIEKSKSSEN